MLAIVDHGANLNTLAFPHRRQSSFATGGQKALEVLKARDAMMKLDIEKVRLDIALG